VQINPKTVGDCISCSMLLLKQDWHAAQPPTGAGMTASVQPRQCCYKYERHAVCEALTELYDAET